MKKKLLSLLLSVVMILSMLPVSALATGDVTVTTFDELKSAIADATDGDTITVQGKIEVTESLVIDNYKSITLEGGELLRSVDCEESLIRVMDGKITLSNIILDGNKDNGVVASDGWVMSSGCLVSLIYAGASVETVGNTILRNSSGFNGGGAICGSNFSFPEEPYKVIINSGTQILNNEASGGSGGAVASWTDMDVTMYGGVVKNNSARLGGAFYSTAILNLKLLGGEITNNVAVIRGGGVNVMNGSELVVGGGVIIEDNYVDNTENNVFIQSSRARVNIVSDVARIGLTQFTDSPTLPNNNVDVVFNGGFDPTLDMVESETGTSANFFSDNPNYITRIEKDGDNNKVVLGSV